MDLLLLLILQHRRLGKLVLVGIDILLHDQHVHYTNSIFVLEIDHVRGTYKWHGRA
jgi:hypothetical protein